ncbi:MAG: glycoside hydrolase 43 family protein [Lachnospiraceae bacterium]|nr:glycoside hydrolase 43 family protein [Lachnospiraceae bacterium]
MKQFTNPVTRQDYPDVDVIRVDDTYYMVSTTMHYMPGGVILRSYDLVNWEIATYLYDILEDTPAQRMEDGLNIYGAGMWAPTLRYHKGTFYVLFVANDTHKTYLFTSEKIEGPWQRREISGFYHDASLLFDDDDRVYIVYGGMKIYITELKADLSGPKKGGLHRMIIQDIGDVSLGYEGSHFYKINGYYYVFLIHWYASGTKRRVEACYVSDSLEGTFIGRDVLDDDMGYRNAGVAQGGIVDTPDGRWYAMLFQDSGAVGRIPVLVPVRFERNFPVFGADGKAPREVPVESTRPDYVYEPLITDGDFLEEIKESEDLYSGVGENTEDDRKNHSGYYRGDDRKEYSGVHREDDRKNLSPDFGREDYRIYHSSIPERGTPVPGMKLKKPWQWNHIPDPAFYEFPKPDVLRITAGTLSRSLNEARNTLTQRTIFPGCCMEVTVDGSDLKCGDFAGLAAFMGQYGMIALTREEDGFYIAALTRKRGRFVYFAKDEEIERVPSPGEKVRFRMTTDFHTGTDEAVFEYETEEGWKQIGPPKQLYYTLDHFVGCRGALYCYATRETGGTAEFSEFKYIV